MSNLRNIKVVLELIRKAFDYNRICQLSQEINWVDIIEIVSCQGVLGICFQSIEQLPVNLRPDTSNLMNWLGQAEHIKAKYQNHEKVVEMLAQFYKLHGIKMLVLKGYGLSKNYPVPEHRPTGDIDIFLYGKIDDADELVEREKGVSVYRENPHHSVFTVKGVTIENHRTLSDQHNHKSNIRLEQLYAELIAEDEGLQIGDNIYTPSATLNAIYLLRHAGEHFATEKITLRHVLDLGTFFQKHNQDIDWKRVLKVYKDECISDFYNAIATICVRDFGMDAKCFNGYKHDPKLADRVLEDIFKENEKLPMSTVGISGLKKVKYGIQKSIRWYKNRWKYKMVYNESLFESYMTLALNRLR